MLFSRFVILFFFLPVLLFFPLCFSKGGGEVFVEFAKEYLGEEYAETLDESWERKILKHVKNWDEKESL